MSRYQVDKVFHEMLLSPEKRRLFGEDAAAYLEGRDLTDEERTALMEHDYATLYKLGAHPFLLFGWVSGLNRGANMQQVIREYAAAVRPYGYPNWTT